MTNGWDTVARRRAAETFHLDWEEFQDRHELSFPAFDSGLISLDEYLNRILFYRPRAFTREEFIAFMFAQSKEYPESRAVLDRLARLQKYFIGSINNEPLELNEYRIKVFQLRRDFQVFFSSCYFHTRKPGGTIFCIALEVTQRAAGECGVIDYRPRNLGNTRELGMERISFSKTEQ